ncbi:malate synthase G [Alteribacillus iranensis]|uniref:Malate synthase G n=1 Tax=Alteribacillus iranensis TaxID=930128 RepID=A0A1I2DQJ7_9BACI|nr:malate synthase G [Alteribacillus iranensis]SFE82160.1 malate synthase [Alteribacillus iranensis]
MGKYVTVGGLQVAEELYAFINEEAIPETGVSPSKFWQGLDTLIHELTAENKALLEEREMLQSKLDKWHKDHRESFDPYEYKKFLKNIRYLESETEDVEVTTSNVDDEIAKQAGPQLVVPLTNARYALNAANARWGSLYDALYGTDAIREESGAERTSEYNPVRGKKVIEYAKQFLDEIIPLTEGSHQQATQYVVRDGELGVILENGTESLLKEKTKYKGYQGQEESPEAILIENNGIHFEIQIDRDHPIGKTDAAGIKDILMEAALSTLMDCEDSIAAVDAEDKVEVYRNWLGLMKGTLQATFQKGLKEVTRELHPDRVYRSSTGEQLTLPGRSKMFVRNVGHLMTNPAILDKNGEEVPEGILDGVFTSLIAMHDVLGNSKYRNSEKGSIYIVKPKMHGSKEVAFANKLFDKTEELLGLERHTLKMGVMDEERRTSLNLKACIREAKDRIVFINTGFLDRTGDEIHTSMEAGPMIRKGDMKKSVWLDAYERSNVFRGLETGLVGRAQIGKGMWAMPDMMAAMLEQKIGQVKAGANTAWVPSPTAATLHALHYHHIDVQEVQSQLKDKVEDLHDEILQIPVEENPTWSEEEIQEELDNNAQGILGYVVRWVDLGVGCSKVPDINNIGLMEDRATLRISSQHMANWLYHGICTEQQVMDTMKRMAKVVDEQNAGDPNYRPMADDFNKSIAFQAACDLVFKGREQPSGYTEPILHKRRLEVKNKELAKK